MKAFLILENGEVFIGNQIGAQKETICEIVFNTGMTGYTELLTDPSYAGQGVVMTYPLIGNYGICYEDFESRRPWVEAFIVRELCNSPSNFRCEEDLNTFLKKYDIPGIEGIDTRAITKLIRDKGHMNGIITYSEGFDVASCLEKIKTYKVGNVVDKVTCEEKTTTSGNGPSIGLLDFGAKLNIARHLEKRGCKVTIYPAHTSAQEIIQASHDGLMLSNGPGDPKSCVSIIREIKKLYDYNIPTFAICLGHQLMALATGADTHKLKYGHRGVNHPVKDLETGKLYITSQNHGYVVDQNSLDPKVAVERFRNVNDGTLEGIDYIGKHISTVQFHPEAAPGPTDTEYLFDNFLKSL